MKKLTTPVPVFVRWVDSCNLFGDRWATVDELDDESGETFCETLGWLVAQSDRSVFVAGSVAPDEIGSVMQIPKVAVVEQRVVDLGAASVLPV